MKETIINYLKEHGKSSVNDIAQALNHAGGEKFPQLIKAISAMESKGQLRFNRDGSVSLRPKKENPNQVTVEGVFRANKNGFGFLHVDDSEDDMFIGRNDVGHAIDGDTVAVVIKKPADRLRGTAAEARVVEIVERSLKTVVGKFILSDEKEPYAGYIKSKNQKIQQPIYIKKEPVALDGTEIIKVDIEKYPNRHYDYFVGSVRDIIGHQGDAGIDVLEVLESMDIVSEFPEDVMAEAEAVPDAPSQEDLVGRVDLRQEVTFTIDGADAKDLDDAVHIKRLPNGNFELGVHIADVSHYVTENSPLDKEALKRGTSVYLVDRVIPMLPHKLSNGICSLNAGTDRLALSCLMEIDGKGNVIGHRIAETLIQVDRRMTYTAVNAIVTDRDPDVMEEYKDFVPMFDLMKELADILRERRKKRGSIDFDFPESKIILDEKGRPVDIKPYERNAATKIIEDFMLMANETIAEDYFWQELPFLYRTHDYPDPEKMKRLGTFINNFGYTIRTQNGEVHPKELQKLLDKIEGTPEEALISRLTLRSMKQAKYTTVCTGHFGLAANYYTHFTSPIRRYPDLQIHRIIKENLRRGLSDRRFAHYDSILPEVAVQCSSMERRADEAERETDKLKKCEYMSKRIGKEYDGVISGVTNWGLYVELPNTVEGLIRVNDLTGDYFVFDEEHMELVGEMTRKSYKLGQKIRVQVADTDKLTRTIDFIPAKWQEEDE